MADPEDWKVFKEVKAKFITDFGENKNKEDLCPHTVHYVGQTRHGGIFIIFEFFLFCAHCIWVSLACYILIKLQVKKYIFSCLDLLAI